MMMRWKTPQLRFEGSDFCPDSRIVMQALPEILGESLMLMASLATQCVLDM